MLDTPETDPIEFLSAFQPGGPWNLTALTPNRPVASATLTDADEARAWIDARRRSNLYYVVNPAPKATGWAGRVRRADIPFVRYLHVDIDCDKSVDSLTLDQRKARMLDRLDALDNPPTFVIDSGGGLQPLWRLDEPVPTTPENTEWAESANRWLIETYGGDSGTHDISRLLRLPGTVNYPSPKKRARGRVVAPTLLVRNTGTTHEWWEFGQVAHSRVRGSGDVDTSFEIEEVPEFGELVSTYGLGERAQAIILHGRVEGEVKEHDDSNSAWAFEGACHMVRAGLPPGLIAAVLLESEWGISTHLYDQQGRTPELAAKRLAARAAMRVKEDRAAEIAEAFDLDSLRDEAAIDDREKDDG